MFLYLQSLNFFCCLVILIIATSAISQWQMISFFNLLLVLIVKNKAMRFSKHIAAHQESEVIHQKNYDLLFTHGIQPPFSKL